MNLSRETSTENAFSRSEWYVPVMDKLIGGFMMSLMQSGSADTWAASARKADKQHRDTVKMAEIEVFAIIVFSLAGWTPASFRTERVLFRPSGVNLRGFLCGVHGYASA